MGGARRRIARPGGPLLLGLPAMIFLLLIFIGPVVRLLLLSVEGGSLAAYEKALTDGLYLRVFLDTFEIAAIVTVCCALLGYPVAYVLTTLSRGWAAIGFACILIPLRTSVLVPHLCLDGAARPQRHHQPHLMDWGATDRPLALMYNLPSVIIGMTHVLLPMFILPVYSVMVRVDRELLRASDGLGASGGDLRPRLPAADLARRAGRRHPGLHHLARLLHHAGAARRRPRRDDRQRHRAPGAEPARLALRQRALDGAAAGDPGDPGGLQPRAGHPWLTATPCAPGCGACCAATPRPCSCCCWCRC
jgi:hypothetical protein